MHMCVLNTQGKGVISRKPNKVSFESAASLRNSRLYDRIDIISSPMQWTQRQGQIIISYVMKGTSHILRQ